MSLRWTGVRSAISSALAAMLLLSCATVASARTIELPDSLSPLASSEYVEGQLLVVFKPSAGPAAITDAHRRTGARPKKRLKAVPGLELVDLPKGTSVEQAIAEYEALPGVAYAQPNYRYELATPPNDTQFDSLWGLHNTGQTGGVPDEDIDAPEAWGIETGSSDVIVAVADTGAAYDHPELAPNIWVNAGEVPGNGVDDDSNGYVDDVRGIDTIDGDVDPMDTHGHGTHVSGTIGAAGNNASGVTGVNWDVSIMPLRIFGTNGTTEAAVLEAWAYAHDMGAKVVNNSWGGIGTPSAAMEAAIAGYADMLFVCAAGNGDHTSNGAGQGDNNDVYPYYPASFDEPNIISVGAVDHNGQPTSFSNYGATSVDVYAPGSKILSTIPGTPEWVLRSGLTATTLWSDDFDTLGGWTVSSGAGKPWVLQTKYYSSGSTAAGLLDYGNNESSRLTATAPLDLSGATNPWMRWWMGYSLEHGWDFVRWGVRDASSGTDHYLGSGTGTGNMLGHFTADLSEFIGQNDIYPFFELKSDNNLSSANHPLYLGAWVDDVEVLDVASPIAVLRTDAFGSNAGWQTWAKPATNPWSWGSSGGFMDSAGWSLSPYSANSESWLWTSSPIDLSGGSASVSLRANFDFYPPNDYVLVCASHDDGDYYAVGALEGSTIGWERHEVDLGPFAGDDSVWLAFILVSDLANPGSGIRIDDLRVASSPWVQSINYDNAYEAWDGTSMASPHVAGIAALLLAHEPTLTTMQLKSRIVGSVDQRSYGAKPVLSGGRVNALKALGGTPPNSVPVAVNDSYTASKDTQLVVPPRGVLNNDTDSNGDSLTAVLVSGPAHGTVNLDSAGGFTYTPSSGFVGTDTFTYKANDGTDDSSAATVTITVNPPPPVLTPVYRFFRPSTGTHFYTSDATEMQRVRDTMASTYTFEGVGYYINSSNPANSVPLYRFYNKRTGTHLYTADEGEKNSIVANLSAVYTLDGVSYHVSQSTGTQVYRFYSPGKGVHFYSSDQGEIDYVRTNLGHVWSFEGPAYKVGQ